MTDPGYFQFPAFELPVSGLGHNPSQARGLSRNTWLRRLCRIPRKLCGPCSAVYKVMITNQSSRRRPKTRRLIIGLQAITGAVVFYFVISILGHLMHRINTYGNSDGHPAPLDEHVIPQSPHEWNHAFEPFTEEDIQNGTFDGVGRRLDKLLESHPNDWCVTAAELGEAAPYLVLRAATQGEANRHFVNARVEPLDVLADSTGRTHRTQTSMRKEIATHCQFYLQQLGSHKDKNSRVFEQITLPPTPTKGKKEQSHVSKTPLKRPSLLWKLHLHTQTWLSQKTGDVEVSILHSDNSGYSSDHEVLPTQERDRYLLARITAYDPQHQRNVVETLVNTDAFCAQAYAEIALGLWPCNRPNEHVKNLKTEL
jgi:hypothetical protein